MKSVMVPPASPAALAAARTPYIRAARGFKRPPPKNDRHPDQALDKPWCGHDIPRRSPGCPTARVRIRGAVAQLGERLVRNEKVSGSIPLSSTISLLT